MFSGSNIKEIEPAELAKWGKDKGGQFRIIDVRQPQEIMAGTVPGAEALPLHTLPLRMGEFDANEELVFVCRSGARSAQACLFLLQQGFRNVVNLRGGMIAWASQGQPVTLPKAI